MHASITPAPLHWTSIVHQDFLVTWSNSMRKHWRTRWDVVCTPYVFPSHNSPNFQSIRRSMSRTRRQIPGWAHKHDEWMAPRVRSECWRCGGRMARSSTRKSTPASSGERESVEYKLRNLPCTICPDDKLWTVCGNQKTENGIASGVLEWCYDQRDAETTKSMMKQDPNFTNLEVMKWTCWLCGTCDCEGHV